MAGIAKRAAAAGAAMGAIAAAVGGAAMARGLKMAADLGGRLADIASRTGIAAGQVALLERAFEDNGIAAAKVGPTINKMQKAISDAATKGGAMEDALNGIGLSAKNLQSISPEDQFAAIQKSISGIQDPAKRAAAAMQIFGKSGGELLTLFDNPDAMAKAAKSLGSQAEILERRAQTFDRISDILKGVGAKMQGFFVGMLDRIADPVLVLLEKFESLDLAAIGQRAGDALKDAAKWSLDMIDKAQEWGETLMYWIKIAGTYIAAAFSPQFWESVKMRAQAAFLDIANVANGAFQGVVAGLIAGFKGAGEIMAKILQTFTRPGFWDGLLKVFQWLALSFGSRITGMIASVLDKISALPGMKKLLGDTPGNVREMSDFAGAGAEMAKSQAQTAMAPIFDGIAETAKNSASKTAKAVSDAFAKGSSAFDTGKLKDAAERAMDPITDALAEAFEKPEPRRRVSDAIKGLLEKATEAVTKDQSAPLIQARGFGSIRSPLGGDNVFARDRARLGLASGLTTGGLGERRRVGRSPAEMLGMQQKSLQEEGNDILTSIHRDLREAITV
jgi:hypothetical protein